MLLLLRPSLFGSLFFRARMLPFLLAAPACSPTFEVRSEPCVCRNACQPVSPLLTHLRYLALAQYACDRCGEEMASWHPELPCFAGPCLATSTIQCSGQPPSEDMFCSCKHAHGLTEAGQAEDHCARFVIGEAKQCDAAAASSSDDDGVDGWLSNKTGGSNDGPWMSIRRRGAETLRPQ